MSKKAVKTLVTGQYVTAQGWDRGYRFMTVAGMASRDGRDVEEAVARAERLGHDLAFAINSGTMIVGDRETGRLLAKQELVRRAEATELADGEVVEIGGERFTVKLVGERYADPVHFKRVSKRRAA